MYWEQPALSGPGNRITRPSCSRSKTGAWAPGRLPGLKNCLPLDASAGSSSQVLRDMAPGASPTYRGTDGTVEATDPTWTAEGLSFDGGDGCTLSDAPLFNPAAPALTIAAVFKTATYGSIYSEYGPGAVVTAPFWSLDVGGSHYCGVSWRPTGGGYTYDPWPSAPIADDDTWHIAIVAMGTDARIYVDGVLRDTAACPSGTGFDTLNAVRVGDRLPGVFPWNGSIAYLVRVASALSAVEMACLHNYIRRQVTGRGIDLPFCPLI